MQTTAELKTCL